MKQVRSLFLFCVLFIGCIPAKYKELKEGMYAEIETNKGTILLELYAEKVPKTVANFVALVEGTNRQLPDSLKGKNFYQGIIFHRVVPNFVIQGGGFTAAGKKSVGYVFTDEFPKDPRGNLFYKHDDQGVFSMANGGIATNNTQFFITHRAIPHLNGKHSVFGKTIINSIERKELEKNFLDSLQLKNEIRSARMSVVNKIERNDTINTIEIIRIGAAAKNFNAAEVFEREESKFKVAEGNKVKEAKAKNEVAEEKRYAIYLEKKAIFLKEKKESKAQKTGTGLRILMLRETSGKRILMPQKVSVNYIVFTADGKRVKSSKDIGKPTVFDLNDTARPMISGLKEGLLSLREGEKARLFIPYMIGFGTKKFGPFPAKSDLVFEVEILKINY
ncbi:peptidyl-prolyl cis-trans isomerase [Polaribacter irgensii 23-P]|uniref:peptidylprolyl isomerase n=1 Tax=Polaribacter irgensii 23-P TaxID=313594 RepID=A4C1M0_9FLAO|nr:peptidylprolyl isomerase [Polaribacter irgensii]EAR12023.1 peptidyl-prolyl cis-trans isomerase [Polaribacter irgensii 23-P]